MTTTIEKKAPMTFSPGGLLVAAETLVIGEHPQHVHSCGCKCNSPYCETPPLIPCPNHGGPPIVLRGLEPWRR